MEEFSSGENLRKIALEKIKPWGFVNWWVNFEKFSSVIIRRLLLSAFPSKINTKYFHFFKDRAQEMSLSPLILKTVIKTQQLHDA